jgi:hypothetical protein
VSQTDLLKATRKVQKLDPLKRAQKAPLMERLRVAQRKLLMYPRRASQMDALRKQMMGPWKIPKKEWLMVLEKETKK